MKTRHFGFLTLAAGALAIGIGFHAGPAAATALSCSTTKVTFTLAPASDVACFGGNDTNTIDSTFSLFGNTGWVLADKSDDTNSGNQSVYFTDLPTSGEQSGTWAINALPSTFDVVMTLKQADYFAAFLITGDSGTWATSGPGNSVNALSHGSLYYRDNGKPTTPSTPVPAPGPTLLLLLGLAGIAGWRYWRQRPC